LLQIKEFNVVIHLLSWLVWFMVYK